MLELQDEGAADTKRKVGGRSVEQEGEMISDEELREIAEELRIHGKCIGFEDCTECQALSMKLFGDKFVLYQLDNRDANCWGIIADLIDRPTCHDLVEHKRDPFTPGKRMVDGYFHCSDCGWDGQIWEHIGFGDMLAYEAVHCPKCGKEIKR